jgi:rapamycin-insensitive companion of mTOR
MTVLETHRYRLPIRRFILDLFDKSVMRKIVLQDFYLDDQDGDEAIGDDTVVA